MLCADTKWQNIQHHAMDPRDKTSGFADEVFVSMKKKQNKQTNKTKQNKNKNKTKHRTHRSRQSGCCLPTRGQY